MDVHARESDAVFGSDYGHTLGEGLRKESQSQGFLGRFGSQRAFCPGSDTSKETS